MLADASSDLLFSAELFGFAVRREHAGNFKLTLFCQRGHNIWVPGVALYFVTKVYF